MSDTNQFLALALNKKEAALKNFLGGKEEALKFMSSVMQCVQMNPDLLKCSQESLLSAFMEGAALGLYPGSSSGDCYVIPYKEYAQFQIGYRGFKTLAYRSGVLRVGAEVVYENDSYTEMRGTNPHINHVPNIKDDRGKWYRVYAWAEIAKGDVVFDAMSKDEVMKIKAKSPGASHPKSPWNEKNDPMLWMPRKTIFKQLAKMIPTSDKLQRAVYLDNVAERGGYIDGEGEIVEIPFEVELDEETMKEIDEIKDVESLKKYWEANKGKGKLFDKYIIGRKETIMAQTPKIEEPKAEEKWLCATCKREYDPKFDKITRDGEGKAHHIGCLPPEKDDKKFENTTM